MFKKLINLTFVLVFLLISLRALPQERRVWIQAQDDLLFLYQDKFALLIGISNYKYLPRLIYPLSDCEEIKRALEELGFQVQILRNPTSNELRNLLRGLPYSEIGRFENSALLLYFAGHCYTERMADGRRLGYIIPIDSPIHEAQRFATMNISMNEIVELATLLRNRHVLMLFDCCFSGSLFNLMRATPSPVNISILYPVRQFITAGREDEEAPDESLFKRFFINGIRGEADFDRDGFVTGTELGNFLQERVERETNGRQHPQFGKINNPELDKGDFVFVTPNNRMIMPAPPEGGGFIRPNRQRWYIYKDADSEENHGEWTNWMAEEGQNPKKVMELNLRDEAFPYSGRTAIKVRVNFQNSDWGGVAVASLPNYWGEQPSEFCYDLSNAQRLIFHAKGELGGECIQVKVAIAGDQPYGDSARTPAATRWITLSTEWQMYELSLEGYNLRRVITPFCFVTDRPHNNRESITFYLDEIYFVLR